MGGNLKFPDMKTKLVAVKPELEQRYCKHLQLELHPDIRLLLCTKCKLWLDPFDFLVNYAGKAMLLEATIRYMREEKDKLSKTLTELQRQERNAKARLRNYRKKS